MKQVYNNVWNRLNPWSNSESELPILDPYTINQIILEMGCNEQDHSAANIAKCAIASVREKMNVAIEIIKQHANVLEIYLFEQENDIQDYRDLYEIDDFSIYSTHIKKIPTGDGSNCLVSYRGYLKFYADTPEDQLIPSWDSLADYWVRGEHV